MPSALQSSRRASSRCGPTGTAGRVTNSSCHTSPQVWCESCKAQGVRHNCARCQSDGLYRVTKVDFLLTDGGHHANSSPTAPDLLRMARKMELDQRGERHVLAAEHRLRRDRCQQTQLEHHDHGHQLRKWTLPVSSLAADPSPLLPAPTTSVSHDVDDGASCDPTLWSAGSDTLRGIPQKRRRGQYPVRGRLQAGVV